MTIHPWSQPCPICGRPECAWHEKGGMCDGTPQEGVVVQLHPAHGGLPDGPLIYAPKPFWVERLWAWLLDFPTPWSTP